MARGLILHARFQSAQADADSLPAEDPAELALFERALELYRALRDTRGEAEALFWIGCLHQFIRHDNETAVPYLERSCRLATQTGDKPTPSSSSRLSRGYNRAPRGAGGPYFTGHDALVYACSSGPVNT